MTTLTQLIDRATRWHRDRVAVLDGDRSLTFGEVGARSNRLANALHGLGAAPGDRVALLLPNRLESVEADLALVKAGLVKVPINPRLVDREREYLLANSGARALIFDAQFSPFVDAARERLPELREAIALDGAEAGGALAAVHDYEDLLARASDRPPGVDLDPDAPSFILYTSGTTGRPKGATATNRSRLAATFGMLADEIDARPGDGMVHVGSMAHGSGSKVIAYFVRGARNLPVAKFEPDRFLALVERERATSTFVVPTMISMLLEAAEGVDCDLSSLRTVSYGGAPISPTRLSEALERFGPVFVQVYGSCEAPHPVLVLSREEHLVDAATKHRLGSVGRETTLSEVQLFDADGEPSPDGEPGEMWVRGGSVMAGYWENPEANDACFQEGWYRSGDVARRDEDGYYYIVDRARDMVISGGLNVYPSEVEAALYRHPAVAEAAVIGVPDDHWGEAVAAYVVVRDGAGAGEEDLIEHCRRELAGYKKPRFVYFVEELPKGSTGKVLKRELKAPHWEGHERSV
jgi:acyl-CoA synthetase (AMP-forming)/AMP-acid ligase II